MNPTTTTAADLTANLTAADAACKTAAENYYAACQRLNSTDAEVAAAAAAMNAANAAWHVAHRALQPTRPKPTTYRVTLPDGVVATRKSFRAYFVGRPAPRPAARWR